MGADLLYRMALLFLPREFRVAHAREMRLLFAERLRDARGGGVAILLRELADVFKTAFRLRRAVAHRSRVPNRRGFLPGDFLREVRMAVRAFVQGRHALAAVLTLGIGVAIATTAFSAFNALVLRPLPHRAPEQIVQLWQTVPSISMPRGPVSYLTYQDWKQGLTLLEDVGVYTNTVTTLTDGGVEPERLFGSTVSGNIFELLGNHAAAGRTLTRGDEDASAERVIVLSHTLWQRQFRGEAMVGRSITLNDRPYRVVGIMPKDFLFPSDQAQFWLPLFTGPATQERDRNFLTAIGRLRAGVSIAAAQQQLETVRRYLGARYPDAYGKGGVMVESRRDYVLGNSSRVVAIVLCAALVVLLIACANLTNLLLVRALTRGREFAVRTALGAGRSALIRQAFAEAVVLSGAGIAMALALSLVLQRLLARYGALVFPRPVDTHLDWRTIGFAAAATLLCTLFASVVPAWRASAMPPGEALKSSVRVTASRRTQLLQGSLVCAQIAAAVVLLSGAALLTRSLLQLSAVSVGFQRENVLTAQMRLPPNRYDSKEKIGAFYDELLGALRSVPGVEHAGGTWALPFSDDFASSSFAPVGGSIPADKAPTITSIPVRSDYFGALGMQLMRGRTFSDADRAGAPLVVIVTRSLGQLFWPGQDPVGKQIIEPESPKTPYTVVGVVNDIRRRELSDDMHPEIYLPHAQATWDGSLYLALRFRGSPEALPGELRRQVWRIDPHLAVAKITTLDDMVGRSIAAPRFRTYVLLSLALSAGLLALIGVYGLLAFTVALRKRDIAIRMALGATPGNVLRHVTGDGLRLTAIGMIIGVLGALALTTQLRQFLYKLEPSDPLTYALTCIAVLCAAWLAAILPARRAARIEPVQRLAE